MWAKTLFQRDSETSAGDFAGVTSRSIYNICQQNHEKGAMKLISI